MENDLRIFFFHHIYLPTTRFLQKITLKHWISNLFYFFLNLYSSQYLYCGSIYLYIIQQSFLFSLQYYWCNRNFILFNFQKKCLDILCSPGKMIVNSGCKPLLQLSSKLGYILFASIKVATRAQIDNIDGFLSLIDATFKEHVVRNMSLTSSEYPFDSTYLISDHNCEQDIKKGGEIIVSVYYELFFDFNVNRTNVEEALVQSISSKFNIISEDVTHFAEVFPDSTAMKTPSVIAESKLKNNCHIQEQKSKYKYQDQKNIYIYSNVTDLLLCEQVELSSDEYEIDNSTLVLNLGNRMVKLSSEKYIFIAPNKARLCVKYLTPMTLYTWNGSKDTITFILTFICMGISLLCLLVSFFTYCIFKSLRTLAGKNNICLLFTMICANVMYLLLRLNIVLLIGCTATSFLSHYFLFARLLCSSVCSFHMYRVFSNKTVARLSERFNLICYILFSFGTPVVVILIKFALTFVLTDNKSASKGYNCVFFEHDTIFYLITIGLMCCFNIFFFISTVLIIVRRPKLTNDSKTNRNKVYFIVYLKLFTITGIIWVLRLIGWNVNNSVYNLITIGLNSLQGVFFFLSFICNKRVFNLYRNCFKSFRNPSKWMNISRGLDFHLKRLLFTQMFDSCAWK